MLSRNEVWKGHERRRKLKYFMFIALLYFLPGETTMALMVHQPTSLQRLYPSRLPSKTVSCHRALVVAFMSSSAPCGFDPEEYLRETPYYPPLTDRELENRNAEMVLVAKLENAQVDDKTIAEFKKHWFSERGPDCEALLLHADFCIGKGPSYWEEAILIFHELIRQDPTFLEPKARLAKLLCLQGHWDESLRWAQQVLDSKPWHFVTLETMVALHTGKEDSILSELWKARRLPTSSQTKARTQWVDRAVGDAQVILSRMQQQREQGKED